MPTLHFTRLGAAQAGEPFYRGLKACQQGHEMKRYTSSGTCVACSKEHVKRWQEKVRSVYRQARKRD